MARKSQARDNAYYLERLRLEHPAVYGDFLSGKYGTLAAARRAAGSLKSRTRLQELNNAWGKATPAEQAEFMRKVGCVVPAAPAAGLAAPATFSVNGRLEPRAKGIIADIMVRRGLVHSGSFRWGAVLRELGYTSLNPSLGLAMSRGTQIHDPDLVKDLEAWVAKHRGP
jgi:hypothetical protein